LPFSRATENPDLSHVPYAMEEPRAKPSDSYVLPCRTNWTD